MSQSRDADLYDATLKRRMSARQVRHRTNQQLSVLARDADARDGSVLPVVPHDVGRHTTARPAPARHPEQRQGFKVWKTPFWKRRTQLRVQKAVQERRLPDEE